LIEVLAQVVGVAVVPLNVTVLVPWDVPKFVPLIVTDMPTAPELGVRLVMLGVGRTVKLTPLLATPLTVTTTLPVAAPVGTGTWIEVLFHAVGVAVVLSKTTVLVPWDVPKFVPAIVTTAPTGPELGVRLVMLGVGRTVKLTPLLATPFTVTTMLPVVAPAGTGTLMEALAQVVGVAVVPLNVTVLVPWDEPKFVPAIVTDTPTAPEVGVGLVMLGVGRTVKLTPLLATPLTVITTLPVAAPVGTGTCIEVLLHAVGVAVVLSNTTVLVPWVAPKFVPVIVATAPTGPELGLRLVMLGVGRTVKLTPLLDTPLTVTTTVPLVAPAGTGTFMEALAHMVGVPAVPLNVTGLVPCEVPKFVPAIVTDVPTAAEVGVRLVMLGVGRTVKLTPLLATPLTVTTTLPVAAPVGTGTCIEVLLQVVGVAVVPSNTTVLVLCVAPKLVPAIVTAAPTGPEFGVKLVMLGVGRTVKLTRLLATPPTITTTLPVVAPAGTGTLIEVLAQVVGVAVVPLNVTVLVPWDVPKFVPLIVTETPTAAEVGVRLVILGVAAAEIPAQKMT
jgi:hypothetical protein